MDSCQPLNTKRFQKLVIGIISVCFGSGLSAAYSVSDYMHSVKSEFTLLRNTIEFNQKEDQMKILEVKNLLENELSFNSKNIYSVKLFVTKQDAKLQRVSSKVDVLESKHQL